MAQSGQAQTSQQRAGGPQQAVGHPLGQQGPVQTQVQVVSAQISQRQIQKAPQSLGLSPRLHRVGQQVKVGPPVLDFLGPGIPAVVQGKVRQKVHQGEHLVGVVMVELDRLLVEEKQAIQVRLKITQ